MRKLAVYWKSVELADELHACVLTWGPLDKWTVGIQLLRSVDSIGANLAEARGRETDGDRRRFLLIARGSAFETEHWLERAEGRHLPCPKESTTRAREVSRMLNGLTRAWSRPRRLTPDA